MCAIDETIGVDARIPIVGALSIASICFGPCPVPERDHHVTFTTESARYDDIARAFRPWIRRIERRKHSKGPLVYVGTVADGTGDARLMIKPSGLFGKPTRKMV